MPVHLLTHPQERPAHIRRAQRCQRRGPHDGGGAAPDAPVQDRGGQQEDVGGARVRRPALQKVVVAVVFILLVVVLVLYLFLRRRLLGPDPLGQEYAPLIRPPPQERRGRGC